jgi:hypothetical protein
LNTSKTFSIPRAAAAAVFAGAVGLLSVAPALAQPVPSYASGSADETIRGTVAAINGPYAISVRDARGFIDNVQLHQGTIINPTGLTLAPGQSVTILGRNDGRTFSANEIDTPYETVEAVPLYPAYGYYGYPYPYGFGPSYHAGFRFGRSFGFGFRG